MHSQLTMLKWTYHIHFVDIHAMFCDEVNSNLWKAKHSCQMQGTVAKLYIKRSSRIILEHLITHRPARTYAHATHSHTLLEYAQCLPYTVLPINMDLLTWVDPGYVLGVKPI